MDNNNSTAPQDSKYQAMGDEKGDQGGKFMDYDYHFKLLLLGNSGVGKSSIVLRYAENTYSSAFFNTIGVDFKIKTLKHENSIYKIQIWDTAGQERFRKIINSYYKGSHGVIVVYDITDPESFNDVKFWFEEVEKYSNNMVCKLIVGNKCDLEEKRVISTAQGEKLAKDLGCNFLEVSAKESTHIDDAFMKILLECRDSYLKDMNKKKQKDQTKVLNNKTEKITVKGGCCLGR